MLRHLSIIMGYNERLFIPELTELRRHHSLVRDRFGNKPHGFREPIQAVKLLALSSMPKKRLRPPAPPSPSP
jgi:hypothetical protein